MSSPLAPPERTTSPGVSPRESVRSNFATLDGTATVGLDYQAVNGRLVKTLVQREFAPGRYSVDWTGTDDSGRTAASGTYLVRMIAPDTTVTRRMLLLK